MYESFDKKYESIKLIDSAVVGKRKVYALGIKDIFDYVGKEKISFEDVRRLPANVYPVSSIILRSAETSSPWVCSDSSGPVFYNTSCTSPGFIRAAFKIDRLQYLYRYEYELYVQWLR